MAFFADLPDRETVEEPRWIEPEWRRVPHEFLPVSVPFSAVLFQDDDVAATIQGVDVYPTGITFTLLVVRHPEWNGPREALEQFAGHGGSKGGLRLGFALADGRRAEWPSHLYYGGAPEPGRPDAHLITRGGSASGDVAASHYFAWPLPDEGDLTLYMRWDERGVDEASAVIPGDALRAAAASTTALWPGATVPPASQHH
jgi:hypothetical protein